MINDYCSKTNRNDAAMFVNGSIISSILESQKLSEEFAKILVKISMVIVYRCAPSQKAETVKFVKKHKQFKSPVTVAVGDGANDVSMINQASVGIGLQGNEGNSA